jgi:hypothetical protein
MRMKRGSKINWRKLHSEELHNLFSSIKSRTMSWATHAAHEEEKKITYSSLIGKPKAKRQLNN